MTEFKHHSAENSTYNITENTTFVQNIAFESKIIKDKSPIKRLSLPNKNYSNFNYQKVQVSYSFCGFLIINSPNFLYLSAKCSSNFLEIFDEILVKVS